MTNDEPAWLDLATVAELIARQELTASQVLEAVLARIERLNPTLNAYLTVLGESARAEAAAADAELRHGRRRGPLHGVTVAVKDLIHVAGAPTTAGSRTVGKYVASADATCISRLRAAGAIIVGKLHTHELAGGPTSESEVFGRARNPWNLDYIPGGSSGGSAIAAAAALAHGTLGTDTGGSVRMPAAYCGVVGLKATYGRVSRRGVLVRSWTMDHVGPLARRVRDAALLLQAIAGHDPGDPYGSRRRVPDFTAGLAEPVRGVRAGVLTGPFFESRLDPQIGAAFDPAVKALADLGVRTKAVTFPLAEAAQAAGTIITVAEAVSTQDEVIRAQPQAYGADIRAQLYMGEFISARQYLRALRIRAVVQQALAALLREVDVLVTPTTSALPTRSDGTTSGESIVPFGHNTRPFSMPGLPAISVPAGFSREGLPIGLQIVGRPFDEATILRLGHAYESATPWHTRRPPHAEQPGRVSP